MLKNRYSYGIFFKIVHSLSFTIMSILMLECSKHIPLIQVLFFRALIGGIILFVILLSIKKVVFFKISKNSLVLYLSRAAISTFSLLLWIKALGTIGINEAMILGCITPMWLMLFAILTCKERLTIRAVIVLFLNTVGVLMVYQPTMNKITLSGFIAALVVTMLWAVYDVICKKQAETDDTIAQAFYVHFFILILCLPLVVYSWKPMIFIDMLGVLLISIVGLLNIMVLFIGYKFAPIIVLIPFSYFRILFAVVFSYLIYDKLPTYSCVVGASTIFIAELYYYIFEHRFNTHLKQDKVYEVK